MARRRNQRINIRSHQNGLSLPFDFQIWSEIIGLLGISPQQARIVECMLQGLSDKQIAVEIGITVATVRTHLRRLFQDLEIDDRVQLLLRIWHTSRDIERNLS